MPKICVYVKSQIAISLQRSPCLSSESSLSAIKSPSSRTPNCIGHLLKGWERAVRCRRRETSIQALISIHGKRYQANARFPYKLKQHFTKDQKTGIRNCWRSKKEENSISCRQERQNTQLWRSNFTRQEQQREHQKRGPSSGKHNWIKALKSK